MTRKHDPVFYIASGDKTRTTLGDDDSHHLIKARRVEVDDVVNVCDGQGSMFEAIVIDAGPPVALELGPATVIQRTVPSMTSYQALAKSDKNEWVIQKLVEIGIDEVVFFVARRSVPRWDETKASKMRARHQAIALSAAKQSRRAWLPLVRGPISFEEMTSSLPPVSFIAEAGAAPMPPPPTATDQVGLIVGPEGGFDPGEVGSIEHRGAIGVGLGANILRTETAALVMATVARRAFGLM